MPCLVPFVCAMLKTTLCVSWLEGTCSVCPAHLSVYHAGTLLCAPCLECPISLCHACRGLLIVVHKLHIMPVVHMFVVHMMRMAQPPIALKLKVLETTGQAPKPRYDHAASLAGEKLVVFGGRDLVTSVEEMNVLNMKTLVGHQG